MLCENEPPVDPATHRPSPSLHPRRAAPLRVGLARFSGVVQAGLERKRCCQCCLQDAEGFIRVHVCAVGDDDAEQVVEDPELVGEACLLHAHVVVVVDDTSVFDFTRRRQEHLHATFVVVGPLDDPRLIVALATAVAEVVGETGGGEAVLQRLGRQGVLVVAVQARVNVAFRDIRLAVGVDFAGAPTHGWADGRRLLRRRCTDTRHSPVRAVVGRGLCFRLCLCAGCGEQQKGEKCESATQGRTPFNSFLRSDDIISLKL